MSDNKKKKELEEEKIEIPPKKEYTPEEIKAATDAAKKGMFMELMPYLIIIIFVVLIRTFIITPAAVNGESMYPTLHDHDIMLLYKLRLKTVGINRFDIVVIDTDDGKLIKRVIGLPGDTIQYKIEDNGDSRKGILYINGEVVEENFLSDTAKVNTCKFSDTDICDGEVVIPEDEYYVMGDNRGNSKDSRMIGTVSIKDIKGITSVIIYPFSRFGTVE